jgi:bifunctional non-homologous end joining protein LigD
VTQLPQYRPQLATLVEHPPSGAQWLHEIKFDGYRIGCIIRDGKVRLESRRNNDWTTRFAEVAEAARQLPVRSALLDGEVAIVNPSGVTSFQALQNAFSGAPRDGLTYFVFDLIHLDGRDIGALPLERRRTECETLLREQDVRSPIRYSQHFDLDGASLLARVCELGGEGIVSKRRDQSYRAGRNDGWLKTKCLKRGEFVIGGFTDPSGSRTGIGALLLGYYESGVLRFAGKVGTGPGFTAAYLDQIRRELERLEQQDCPFSPAPPGWVGRHGHWVRPVRRGEVVFTEWTDARTLRHPSFQGFREPREVPGSPGAPSAPPSAARPPPAPPALPQRLPRAVEGTEQPDAPSAPRGRRRLDSRASKVAAIAITSPDRMIYPALNFTKQDLAAFYATVAPWMLPHVANRPLTLVRCSSGISSPDALREQCQFLPHEPAWYGWASAPIRRAQIQEQHKVGEYVIVDSPEGLVALVQGDIVEIHVWNSTVDHLEQPDRIVLDLDPGESVQWAQVVAAARHIRDLLGSLGLQCWPKLTGGKGLHLVVPFQPEHGWDATYLLAHRVAQAALERHPNTFTLDFSKQKRARRILIDYKRNHRGAVAVAAYSTRARPNGPVGIPVSWREIGSIRGSDHWTVDNLRQRLQRLKNDPWRDFWTCRQRLTR